MTKPTIKLVDSVTGEEIEREMNLQEFAQWEADNKEEVARKEAKIKEATQKAALLERLGITAEEAKLLLG
jgi:hypothetical protein